MEPAYQNAPIREAVIDLQVQFETPPSLHQLRQLQEHLPEEYCEGTEKREAHGRLEAGETVSAQVSQVVLGYVFRRQDKRFVFQALKNRAVLSHLAPYTSWTTFSQEARTLWNIYRTHLRPQKIIRVGVRYINRIDLPGPQVELKQYFCIFPQLPQEVSSPLSEVFLRVCVRDFNLESHLLLTQALLDPETKDNISMLLDIDIFRMENIPQDEEALWALLEKFRQRKNQVFEACITDRTRELFR